MIYQNEETMSVAQLIEELKKMPQHLPVRTQGCDCYGGAAKVKEYIYAPADLHHVNIERY